MRKRDASLSAWSAWLHAAIMWWRIAMRLQRICIIRLYKWVDRVALGSSCAVKYYSGGQFQEGLLFFIVFFFFFLKDLVFISMPCFIISSFWWKIMKIKVRNIKEREQLFIYIRKFTNHLANFPVITSIAALLIRWASFWYTSFSGFHVIVFYTRDSDFPKSIKGRQRYKWHEAYNRQRDARTSTYIGAINQNRNTQPIVAEGRSQTASPAFFPRTSDWRCQEIQTLVTAKCIVYASILRFSSNFNAEIRK